MIVAPLEISLKNGRKLILRSVRPSEAQLLLDHLIMTAGESYQNLNRGKEYWEALPVADEEKLLTNLENANMRFMMGAFIDNRIVGGLGIFGSDPGTFTRFTGMLGISIQKDFQNTGLGSAMMKYGIQICKEAGLHRLELSVRTYNPGGIFLYEKCGFEKVGLLKDTAFIDGKFVDEYLYQLVFK